MKKAICSLSLMFVVVGCGAVPEAETLLAESGEAPSAEEALLAVSDESLARESERRPEKPPILFLRCDVDGDGKVSMNDIELFTKTSEHPRELPCPAVLDGDNNSRINKEDKQTCIHVAQFFKREGIYPFPWRETKLIKKTQCKRVL